MILLFQGYLILLFDLENAYLDKRLGRRICAKIENPILCAHLNGPVQANVYFLVL